MPEWKAFFAPGKRTRAQNHNRAWRFVAASAVVGLQQLMLALVLPSLEPGAFESLYLFTLRWLQLVVNNSCS
jgi:hypothetical protein